MNAVTAKILIEAFSVNAKIEAMKIENQKMTCNFLPVKWVESDFFEKAEYLFCLSQDLQSKILDGIAE